MNAMPWAAVLLLSPSLLAGCFTASWQVRDKAKAALQCDVVKVNEIYPPVGVPHARTLWATGCGRSVRYVETCPTGKAGGSSGCEWVDYDVLRLALLRPRIAFETSCPDAQVAISEISKDTFGVTACGQRLVYLWLCPPTQDAYSVECKWVMNTDSQRRESRQ